MRFAFSVADWLIRESWPKTRAPPVVFFWYLTGKNNNNASMHDRRKRKEKKANAKHIVIK
jgi:hypothetical protein